MPPRMLNEEETRQWRELVRATYNSAEARARRDQWAENREKYEGKLWGLLNFESSSPANLMALHVKNLIARVYMQRPDIDVMPATPTFVDKEGLLRDNEVAARVKEKALEWWYRETEQHREEMRSILNCILCGLGVQAVGYDSQFVYSEQLDPNAFTFGHTTVSKKHFHVARVNRAGLGRTTHDKGHSHVIEDGTIEPAENHFHEIEQVYDPVAAENAWQMFRDLHYPDERDPQLQYNETIRRERPWRRDIEPEDFIIDPISFGARIETARWAGYKQYVPRRDVEENHLFRNTADIHDTKTWNELFPNENALFYESSADPNMPRVDEEFVEVWTIFIKHDPLLSRHDRDHKVLVLSLDENLPFYYNDNPYNLHGKGPIDGLPFAILHWNEPAGRKFYPNDDITLYANLFHDWLEIREFVARQVTRDCTNVTLYDMNATTGQTDFGDMIESAEDGDVVGVMGKPADAIGALPKPGVSQELLMLEQQRRQEIRELSRENELRSGTQLPTKRTATEITEMQAGADSVLQLDRFEIQEFISKGLRMVSQLMDRFFDANLMFRIIGPDGDFEWVPYDREQVQGEFYTSIVVNSVTPLNKQTKLEQMRQVFPLIGDVLMTFPEVGALFGPQGIAEMVRSMLTLLELDNVNKILGRNAGQQLLVNQQSGGLSQPETGGGSTALQQGPPQNSIPNQQQAAGQGATL